MKNTDRKSGQGVPGGWPALTDEQKQARLEDWVEMSAQGATLEEMGQRYNVTRERVRQILKKEGGIVQGDVKAARMARIRAIPQTCKYCGEQFMRGEKHWIKGKHRKLVFQRTPEQMARDAAIVADYEEGMLLRDILAKYHTSATMVTRALWWSGLRPNRRATSRLPTMAESYARMDAIVADYQRGNLTNMEIAAKHGVTDGMIALALKRAGLPAPTPTEAQRRRACIMRKRRRSA